MILKSPDLEKWLSTLKEAPGVCGRILERSPAVKATESEGSFGDEKRPH